MRKLGSLGSTGAEARQRLERLLNLGLRGAASDETAPLNDKAREFINDMAAAIEENEYFEPSYGQVVYAQDLYDKVML